jgi:hypothetical protein
MEDLCTVTALHPLGEVFLLELSAMLVLVGAAVGGALADRIFYIKPLDYLIKRSGFNSVLSQSVPGGMFRSGLSMKSLLSLK